MVIRLRTEYPIFNSEEDILSVHPPASEVVSYKLSQEELEEVWRKYGPPKKSKRKILTPEILAKKLMGRSVRQVAAEYDMPPKSVEKLMKDWGLDGSHKEEPDSPVNDILPEKEGDNPMRQGTGKLGAARENWPKEKLAELFEAGHTVAQVAEITGCEEWVIIRLRQEYGLNKKQRAEAKETEEIEVKENKEPVTATIGCEACAEIRDIQKRLAGLEDAVSKVILQLRDRNTRLNSLADTMRDNEPFSPQDLSEEDRKLLKDFETLVKWCMSDDIDAMDWEINTLDREISQVKWFVRRHRHSRRARCKGAM